MPPSAHEVEAGDLIVVDVVDLDAAGVDVAQQRVGFAEAAEVVESGKPARLGEPSAIHH
jgi:hypothetical protein